MPKNRAPRTIDISGGGSGGATVFSGGGGGGGGVTDHGALTGLGDDDHTQYYDQTRGDARYVRQVRSIATTAPLRIDAGGSADLSDDRTLSLTLSSTGGLETSSNELRAKLPTNSGIARDSTGLYLSPSTLTVSSSNALSTSTHTHAITSSSSPGAAASLLASNSSGYLTLVRHIATDRVQTPLVTTGSGNLLLDSVTNIVQVDDDLLVDQDAAITRHLQVATDVLKVDATNKVIGVNNTPDGAAALDVRSGTTSDHTVRIKQIASQTGRLWRVENTSGQELIVLDSVGNLQSGNPGFVSGLSGWRITPTGNAEFNNGRFRGELHASVFVFDEVNVQNGTNLVVTHAGVLYADVTLVSTGTSGNWTMTTTAFSPDVWTIASTAFAETDWDITQVVNTLHVKNPETGHYKLFGVGETLRMKAWTGSAITDTWMRVNLPVDETDHWSYTVQVVSGSLPVTYTEGAAIAGYGDQGDGAIRISADDDYGPLIDVFTVGAQPWNGSDIYPHVRLGRLDGVGVPGVSGILQYGMVAGANLADANSPYVVLSNTQQYMYKVKSEWHDGTNITGRIEPNGRVRFGTNVDSPAATFMDIDPVSQLATFRGAVEVLSGTIPSGVVSGLGALATQNDLDGVPNGSTYARVNSTLISGGNIRVGSGTKDSTLNGWHIDSSEIVGQTSGVDQVVLNTSGKITFAGGDGRLDSSGLIFQSAAAFQPYHGVHFTQSAYSGIAAGLWGNYNSTSDSGTIRLFGGANQDATSTTENGFLYLLGMHDGTATANSSVLVRACESDFSNMAQMSLASSAALGGTIFVGADEIELSATNIKLNGTLGAASTINLVEFNTTAW